MRQVFTSPRLENVEAVARMLNEAGIETWINDDRSYKGKRRREFSYKDADLQPKSGVWIVKSDDVTRARELLRAAGLLDSTRPDSYFPQLPESPHARPDPSRTAKRFRTVLVVGVLAAAAFSALRTCSTPAEPEDRSHIVPVNTSTP